MNALEKVEMVGELMYDPCQEECLGLGGKSGCSLCPCAGCTIPACGECPWGGPQNDVTQVLPGVGEIWRNDEGKEIIIRTMKADEDIFLVIVYDSLSWETLFIHHFYSESEMNRRMRVWRKGEFILDSPRK